MGKKSGPGMNNPNHISESLEKLFWGYMLQFFYVDPGSGMEKFGSGIRDGKNSNPGWKKFESGINIPDPLH
jgi:hypothetical protein